MHGHIPEEGEYDLSSQYQWFCRLAEPLVRWRRESDPDYVKDDWVCQCYESLQKFQELFLDRAECQCVLEELEKDVRRIARPIDVKEFIKEWPMRVKKMLEDEK